MNACDRDAGRRLLEGELAPAAESAVVSHLETCPACRLWLEQDAGDASAWESTRTLLGSSAEVDCWPQDAELGDTGPLVEPPLRSARVDLSFLAPADDPAYLGRVGSYEVAGLLGRGGMGVVVKAFDRSLNRHVAVKVLDPATAHFGAARQRFAREARAMAALSHEHVVPIYAVDEHAGLPYFAMEYVAGGTLQARLSREGALDVVAAVRIAMQAARALAAAHDSGLVHRDIKPANILLDRNVERVRVADFGLARIASEASYTASGSLAGTPQFMAPEQVRGEPCDARSDLFSLGSVLYAMCTGREPFRAESVFAVLQRIVHDDPRSIREQNPSVPAWLEAFAAKLMAKPQDERFQSAHEVAELLEQELAHLQNPAHAPAPQRLWLSERSRARRRNSRRAWIAAAALTAAVGAVGGGALYWPRLTSEAETSVAPPSAHEQASPPVELPPAAEIYERIPLWGSDGMADLQAAADLLEARASDLSEGVSPLADPWTSEIGELRRRIDQALQNPAWNSDAKGQFSP